jgi:predicted DNA-binding transcriptional regulator YafY
MGPWYLVGFCRLHGQSRIFQAGRIVDMEIEQAEYGSRQFDPDTFLEGAFGIFKGNDTFMVGLRFDAFISRFVRNEIWHGLQEITENPDGGLTMTLPVSDLTEIKMKVLKYGCHVEVLAPEKLRKEVAEEAKRLVKLYCMCFFNPGSLYELRAMICWISVI